MAVWNFDDFEAEPVDAGARVQRLIHLAGAATSIGLVVGLALWGYRLAVRDVNGIPVIKAIAGPMRVAPEDPGGQVAGNVGLSVNRIAAGRGTGQGPGDKIALAPAQPGLSQADLSPEARAAAKPAAAGATAAAGTAAAAGTMAATDAAATTAAVATTGAATTAQVSASAPAESGAAGQATVATVSVSGTSSLPGGPPLRSLTPPPRPRAAMATASASASAEVTPANVAAAAAAAAAAVASAAPVPRTIDAATLAPGTRLVQLGAFPGSGDAVKQWNALERRFGDLMADKSRVVQKAEAGGRAFYRLRAYGFKGDADARRFCAALAAEGAICVPVVLR